MSVVWLDHHLKETTEKARENGSSIKTLEDDDDCSFHLFVILLEVRRA